MQGGHFTDNRVEWNWSIQVKKSWSGKIPHAYKGVKSVLKVHYTLLNNNNINSVKISWMELASLV